MPMFNRIPTIPQDKAWHFLVGMGIALVTLPSGMLPSVGFVLSAAILKEAWDRIHPSTNTFDVWDAMATLLGGFAVWFPYLIGVLRG